VFWRLDYCNSVLRFVTSHLSYLNSIDYIFTFLSHSHHRKALNSLICADVLLRNYSRTHSVLAGLPRSTEPLQRVLNARLVVGLKPFDSVTPALKQLHWLALEHRIKYKLCLLIHLVHINKAPQCLTDIVTTVAESSARPGLQSADTAAYDKPRILEQGLASVASVLPVRSPGTAYLHICAP